MKKIVDIVRKCFADVIMAIDGTIIMTPNILDAINCIFDARVPDSFIMHAGAEISWLFPTLGSWFNSF